MQVSTNSLRFLSLPALRRVTLPAVTLVLWLVAPAPTQAQLEVIVNPVTHIPQGSQGFVPVFITSLGSPINVAATSAQFQISGPVTGSGQLTFFQLPNAASDPSFANPKYVFFGNSADQAGGIPVSSLVTSTLINTGDATNDGSNVSVPVFPNALLLVDLPISAADTVQGSSFLISQTTDPNFNGFFDNTGAPIPFISVPGTVIIDAPIPEPSTLVVSLVSGLLGLPALLRRWKRAGAAA